MRLTRVGTGIGATLIGLALLLSTPAIGNAQDVGPSGSMDRPLSNVLSSISGLSWNGIWTRSGGEWAWRPNVNYASFHPNVNYVWQSGFGCGAGYGSAGFGWGFDAWSWLPDRYTPYGRGGYRGRWDLVPGGWMWFPGQRFTRGWNAWYLGPRVGFGGQRGCYDAFGAQFRRNREFALPRSSFAAAGWDGELPRGLAYNDANRTAGAGEAHKNPSSSTPPANTPGRDRTRAFIDPVRGVPVVMVEIEGEDEVSSGRTLRDRPLIDPVLPTRTIDSFRRTQEQTRFRPTGMRSESWPDSRRLTTPLLNRRRTVTGVSPTTGPKSVSPRTSSPALARPQKSRPSSSAGKVRKGPEQ
jgi:hypothetical protein